MTTRTGPARFAIAPRGKRRKPVNGIHDLGGMHGFGPTSREEDEPVFHHAWEGRMFGLVSAMSQRLGLFHPDGFRYRIERIDPAWYLASTYYEKWMLVMEQALIEKGLVSAEELDARTQRFRQDPDAPLPRREAPEEVELARLAVLTRPALHRDVGVQPRFVVGDAVRARNINPPGHTRLPRYTRGKQGVIDRVHGVHDFQDTVP
ncbi:MAG: nitrile hydratase subunit beta, partial [Dehalococcoidia bacterium]